MSVVKWWNIRILIREKTKQWAVFYSFITLGNISLCSPIETQVIRNLMIGLQLQMEYELMQHFQCFHLDEILGRQQKDEA